ncbi:MAG: FAD-dependent monooxygenase [Candidatus Dormibacteria bacterium]
MASAKRRAVVIGGSLGGLTSALLLDEVGYSVTVHERSAQLSDRGAGIVAHPESLRYLLDRGVATLDDVSIPSGKLRYLDRAGGIIHEGPVGYRFTSWHALHARLLERLPRRAMRFSQALADISVEDDQVTVSLEGGVEERCDLLVCADGISSTARRLLLPGVEPADAGYIGWRGIVPVAALGSRLRASLGNHITYQLLDSGHTLAYPIPASGGSAGDASLNWVWYRRVRDGSALARAMTDAHGVEHALSVPPGAVGAGVAGELRAAASTLLADDLAELVLSTPQPFIQRVVDVEVPQMAFGRVALVGDAAFVARPHAAAGTAKAAADGWALAAELADADDISAALRRWQPGQLELGRSLVRRSRELGEAQLRGEWQGGDAALLFGLRVPGDSCFDVAGEVTAAPPGGTVSIAEGIQETTTWQR